MADYSPNFSLNRGNALAVDPGAISRPGASAPIVSGGGGSAWGGDPSIALQGGAARFDPTQQAGNMMNIILGLNQNKLFQYKLRSDLAMSEALKRSWDPTKRTVDKEKFGLEIATNPLVALGAPDVLQKIESFDATRLENEKRQLEVAMDRNNKWIQLTSGLLNRVDPITKKPVPITGKDITSALGEASTLGIYDVRNPEEASRMAILARDLIGDGTPPKIRERLLAAEDRLRTAQERFTNRHGQISSVNLGNRVAMVQTIPGTSEAFEVGSLPTGFTPEGAAEPTPVLMRNPDGTLSPSTMPRAAYARTAAGGPLASGAPLTAQGMTGVEATTTQPGPHVAGAPTVVTHGQVGAGVVPSLLTPGLPSGTAAAGSGAQTALDPLSERYQQNLGTAMAEYEKDLNDAVQLSGRFSIQIEQLLDHVGTANDPGVKTGGGREFAQTVARNVQGLLNNTIGLAAYMTGDKEKIKKAEELIRNTVNTINQGDIGDTQAFAKFALQTAMQVLVSQLRGSMGSRINQVEFVAYLNNNPNLMLDPVANRQILAYFKKLAAFDFAEQDFLAKRKLDPDFKIANFPNEWSKELRDKGLVKIDPKGDLEQIKKEYEARLRGAKPGGTTPPGAGTAPSGFTIRRVTK